jgi:hypothetical protein
MSTTGGRSGGQREQLSGPALAGPALAALALAGPALAAPALAAPALAGPAVAALAVAAPALAAPALAAPALAGPAVVALAADTKQFAAGSTSRRWWRKKSTPRIGNLTAAKRRDHLNFLLSNESSNSFSPQQGIAVPEGPASSGPVGGEDDQCRKML